MGLEVVDGRECEAPTLRHGSDEGARPGGFLLALRDPCPCGRIPIEGRGLPENAYALAHAGHSRHIDNGAVLVLALDDGAHLQQGRRVDDICCKRMPERTKARKRHHGNARRDEN